jgi:hypothetical protein
MGAVSSTPELRASAEMRAYLIGQLNDVLRRTGMFSPDTESPLWMVFGHLAYLEGADMRVWWPDLREAWRDRGAFISTGVTGVFRRLIPGDIVSEVASFYGEEARVRGWLTPDRTLSAGEYESMRAGLAAWMRRDRSHNDVLDAFGPPCAWFGPQQPRSGKALAYLSERSEDPVITFHLWDGAGRRSAESAAHGDEAAYGDRAVYGDQAAVVATRCGHGPFSATFVVTPEGERSRPAAERL